MSMPGSHTYYWGEGKLRNQRNSEIWKCGANLFLIYKTIWWDFPQSSCSFVVIPLSFVNKSILATISQQIKERYWETQKPCMVSHLSPTRHALYIFTNHSSVMGAQCNVTFWKYKLVFWKKDVRLKTMINKLWSPWNTILKSKVPSRGSINALVYK